MHECAYGFTGENPHFGNCPNPWDDQRIAGGSSSSSGRVGARFVLVHDWIGYGDSNRSRHGWLATGHRSPNSRPFRLQGLSPFFKLR
jgi:hypothetical protein